MGVEYLKGWIQLTVVCVAVAVFTGCSSHASPLLQGASTPVTPQLPTAESSSAPGVIAEYPIPTTASGATDITSGPASGSMANLWFTETSSEKVGRLTTSGVFSEYSTPPGFPSGITAGPDHNLWFSLYTAIAKITVAGVISSYTLPGNGSGSCGRLCTYSDRTSAGGISAGPDGNLWVTTNSAYTRRQCGGAGCLTDTAYSSQVEVRNTSGELIDEGYIAQGGRFSAGAGDVVSGPDGNLWFIVRSTNQIGKTTTTLTILQYPVPTASSGLSSITVGPDSNLWFTENSANKIGKITTAGKITEYLIPTVASGLERIAAGPDGNLWFTEHDANKVGRITPAGVITEFPIRTTNSGPIGITKGPDGNLWVVESSANKIAKFRP